MYQGRMTGLWYLTISSAGPFKFYPLLLLPHLCHPAASHHLPLSSLNLTMKLNEVQDKMSCCSAQLPCLLQDSVDHTEFLLLSTEDEPNINAKR